MWLSVLVVVPWLAIAFYKPRWIWLGFPLLSFYGNRLFGTRTLDDVYSPTIPYGFLLGFLLTSLPFVYQTLREKKPILSYRPLFYPCAGILILGLLSLIDTVDVSRGGKFFLGWCCYIGFFYFLVNALQNPALFRSYLLGYLLNAVVTSFLMIYRSFTGGFADRTAEVWDLTWMSSNEIGFYFEPIILTCLLILFVGRGKFAWYKWLLPALVMMLAAIVLAGSRGTWVSLIVAFLFMLMHLPSAQKFRIAIGLLLVGVVFYVAMETSGFVQKRIESFSDLTEAQHFEGDQAPLSSIQSREYLLRVGWAVMLNHPLNGVGLGNYPYVYFDFAPYVDIPALQYMLSKPHTPHNFFLRYGSEVGLPGLFVILWLLGYVLKQLRDLSRVPYEEPWNLLFQGFYYGLVANITHCFFQERIFGFYFWSFLGIIYATKKLAEMYAPVREARMAHFSSGLPEREFEPNLNWKPMSSYGTAAR